MPKPIMKHPATEGLEEVKEETGIERVLKILDETPSLGYINKTQWYTMLHFLEKEAAVKDTELKIKVEETKACRDVLQQMGLALKQAETDIKLLSNNRTKLIIAIDNVKAKTQEVRTEADVVMESILDQRRMIHDLDNYTNKRGEMINDIKKETRNYIVTNGELNNVKETALKKRFVKTNEKERVIDRFKRHVTIVKKNIIHDPYMLFGAGSADNTQERDELVFGNNFGANAKEKNKHRRNSTGATNVLI